MPQKVVCQDCNHVLYEGDELKPPDEIIQKHNGKCPNCGRKLSFIPQNVEVKPVKHG
jgi:DNA-directed RNA polymerase subunit RPC12/RpoP